MFFLNEVCEEALNRRNIVDQYFNNWNTERVQRADMPYINLYDKGDEILVTAVLPGIRAEEVNVELLDDSLLIEGERKEGEARNYLRRERDRGKFRRVISLPYRVDRDKIAASLKEGILHITLVKSEDAKPKRITIS